MKQIITICLFVIAELTAISQTYLFPTSGTQTITTCSGKIYDSGGQNGNYSDYSDAIMIVEPTSIKNSIVLQVNKLDFENCCDHLYIFQNGDPYSYADFASIGNYSSNNDNGKIALKFSSDGSSTYSGFEITIGCLTFHDTADLSISNSNIPDSIVRGTILTYPLNYFNDYSQAIPGNISIKTYINSKDDINTATLVDSFTINSINRGFDTVLVSFVIPDTLTEGNYYIFNKIDANNNINERNENNNIYSEILTVLKPEINIGFSNFSLNSDLFISGISKCSFYVTSKGNTPCDKWAFEGYLSEDRDLKKNTHPLNVELTKNNYTDEYYATLSLPNTTILKDSIYYLSLFIKPECGIDEGDTSNNWIKRQVIISENSIDLKISDVNTTTNVIPNNNYTVSFNVSYKSHITLNNLKVSFYLSSDTTLNTTKDSLLSTEDLYLYNNSFSYTLNINYPSGSYGKYYLLCTIDDKNQIPEINEKNNCVSFPIIIEELYIDIELISSTHTYKKNNNTLVSSVNYKNSGNTDIGLFYIGYYLSSDNVFDINDQLIYSEYSWGLTPGSISNNEPSIILDNGVNPVNKYLIIKLDNSNTNVV